METNKKEYDYYGFTVSFSLVEGNTWTEEDTALEEAYKSLIEHEIKFHNDVLSWFTETAPIDKSIEEYRSNLMLIKELSEDARAEADLCIEKLIKYQYFNKTDLMEKFDICAQAINQFHERISSFYPKVQTLNDYLNEYYEREEDNSLWDEFDDINVEHCQNHSINAINVMSFDDNQNRFREKSTYNNSKMVRFIHTMEKYYQNYKRLVLEINTEYAVWQEFTKRVDLMQRIVPLEVHPITSVDNINLN